MNKEVFFSLQMFEEAREYWLDKLSGELAEAKFPADFCGRNTYKPAEQGIIFPGDIAGNLIRIGKNNDLSLYIFLLTALKILLFKTAGEKDIIVGSPVKGAHIHKYNRFVALRDFVHPGMTSRYVLMKVKQTVIDGYKNQFYPIGKLIDFLDAGNKAPLFRIVLLMENIHYNVSGEDIPGAFEKDMIFSVVKNGRELKGKIIYNTALFSGGTVKRLAGFYLRILEQITGNIDGEIGDIRLTTVKEREQILYEFNRTDGGSPVDKALHELFADRAAGVPDRAAVVDATGNCHITYRELNRRAGQVARYLRSGAGGIIALLLASPGNIAAGILAVLKTGAAYLPIESQYPPGRITYMLSDAGIDTLLTDLADGAGGYAGHVQRIVDLRECRCCSPRLLLPAVPVKLSQPAYVIYTSGTTGMPKGVLVEHRSVVNMLLCRREEYRLGPGDVCLQLFSYGFDGFITGFFTPLISGAGVVLLAERELKNIIKINKIILKHHIVQFISVPALYRAIIEDLPLKETVSLKTVVLAGDKLSPGIVEITRRQNAGIEIVNEYGVTEAAVMSTLYRRQETSEVISIGRPIWNTCVYILDMDGSLQPIGIPGELCISGTGVARGYLNNPQLTKQKFLWGVQGGGFFKKSPPGRRRPRSKIYKTGDLARWLVDGTIEFIGRIDYQVKIRGFRIEPGEIERLLLNHKEIKEAAVIAWEDNKGNKSLSAYIVFDKEAVSDLREHLSKAVPDYMIPAHFIKIEKLPLTSSGKIDHKALLRLEPVDRHEYTAPGDEVEHGLVAIWSEVLAVDKGVIGIDSDFFRLGGHSLNANITAAKIHKAFNVKISLGEIFETPTIRGLAEYIKKAAKDRYVSIKAVEEKEYYPLSPAQKRLYILQQLEPGGTGYNVPQAVVLGGWLEGGKLVDAFRWMVRRHESLRTSIEMIAEEPVQRIHDPVEFHLEYCGRVPEPRAFDLSRAPLLRVALVKRSETEHILMVDMHHIITDGTSVGLCIKEFMSLYAGEELAALKFRYRDYTAWRNSGMEKEIVQVQEAFWLKRFAGEIPLLDLPLDYPRPVVQSFAGDGLTFGLDAARTGELKGLAAAEGATLYMALLALYTILLSKISGREAIVVGTPAAARGHADLAKIIGMFVNTLALGNYPSGEKTFRHFLKEVKKRTLEAFENQDYQFEDLVDRLSVPRDAGRNPLFDAMFVLQNMDQSAFAVGDLKIVPYGEETRISKFDLTLVGLEAGERLFFRFEYCTRLFKRETIQRFAAYFKKILAQAVSAKSRGPMLSEIEIIANEEKRRVLFEFNRTAVPYPKDKSIHRLFEEQAERRPNQVALVDKKDISITYRELNNRSHRLACILKGKGVETDIIVGIKVGRSLEMIVGILGILKAGGAYLPIDPDYPRERIDYMLADSGAKLLVTTDALLLPFSPSPLLSSPPSQSSSLAYIIYTSGSTGKPKGVAVRHVSIVNLVCYQRDYFRIDERDVILLFSSICFDASVEQIFIALTGGARLMLIDKETMLERDELETFLETRLITHLHAVPSFLGRYVTSITKGTNYLKRIISGGDVCPKDLAEQCLKRCVFYNEYGPTETTVTSMQLSAREFKTNFPVLPIGRPVGNTAVYILDRYDHLQPIGIVGELCIAGDGLARGYLNRVELTARRFVPSPFTLHPSPLYKTGDLCKWLPEGNIRFIGRSDYQVKIRGYRIEPGEIENRLLKHEAVEKVVVAAHKKENCLYAYIVPNSGGLNPAELKEYLSGTLPSYMLPSYFVEIEQIPLTANGKVDLEALARFRSSSLISRSGYTAPRNKVEERLLEIWRELLPGNVKIGIDDDFFQLGGHSLKATILAAKIEKLLNVRIPLAEIFKTPTVEALARYIGGARQEKYTAVEAAEKKDYYPLSSAQKRLYVLHRMSFDCTGYNIPFLIPLQGPVDRERLEAAFKKLIHRHESIRTSFTAAGEEPVQRIHDTVVFEIESHDLAAKNANIGRFVRQFDLARPPLLRVGVLAEGSGSKNMLVVDMHHIITDGTSQRVLTGDFLSLYNGGGDEMPPLELQYKDYSEWQNRGKEKGMLKQQEDYWFKEFAGEIPVLNIPTDYERPAVQGFAGNIVDFELGTAETKALNAAARSQGVTLFMVLLAVVYTFLSRLSSREDIVVGTPVAGRRHADLDKIVGLFINTLALRSHPSGQKTFGAFLAEVKERTTRAFDNQDYPFEDLVEKTGAAGRDMSRNPLFDVVFTLQDISDDNTGNASGETAGEEENIDRYINRPSKFDLGFIANERREQLYFTLEYCTLLFKRETAARFARYFKKTVSAIVNDPSLKLSDIEIIPVDEKQRVLYEFNDTTAAYPRDETIHGLFAAQAARVGDRVAVTGGTQGNVSITYGLLNKQADRLARRLRAKGVKTDTIVGLMVERCLEMVIGVLGVLKAGGCYLPLDHNYPGKRNEFMLKDCGIDILITQDSLTDYIPPAFFDGTGQVFYLDGPGLFAGDGGGPRGIANAEDSALILYTSGSTGKPKGVMLVHRGMVNFDNINKKIICITHHDRVVLFGSLAYDASWFEMSMGLFAGASVHVLTEEVVYDYRKYEDYLNKHVITVFLLPPVYLNNLLPERVNHLRVIITGGARPTYHLIDRWKGKGQYVNAFGPTEITIGCTVNKIDDNAERYNTVPIGKVIPNTQIYILDKYNHTCPIGTAGELYIGGDGLARGYLNRPELTDQKFCLRRAGGSFEKRGETPPAPPQNFYLTNQKFLRGVQGGGFFKMSPPGRRRPRGAGSLLKSYKTGDLARWLPDGSIEFLGRIDHMVKIRGFRVEPGEIENRLLKYKGVKEAAVIVKENEKGDGYLSAYIFSEPGEEDRFQVSQLREYLAEYLPDYMIPSYFMWLDIKDMPLTPSDKLDKNALPEIEIQPGAGYVAPRNKRERQLVEIWSEVLGIEKEKIGIDDNYFDLGGNSIKIIRINGRVQQVFKRDIPIVTMFHYTTISSLAEYLSRVPDGKDDRPAPGGLIETEKLTKMDEGLHETLELFGEN